MSDTQTQLAAANLKLALIARSISIAESEAIATAATYQSVGDAILITYGEHRAIANQPATLATLAERIAGNPEGLRIPSPIGREHNELAFPQGWRRRGGVRSSP